jgi:hypothetical protein
MEGLQARRVRPGGDIERPTLPITWIVILDDRGTGDAGPSSFDAGTLQWLLADAFQIAIDAAEPKMELCEYFAEEGLKGKRVLIIQTVESRREVWREFTRENCELYGVLELLPLLDNPNQYVLPVVTRFEGRAAPER